MSVPVVSVTVTVAGDPDAARSAASLVATANPVPEAIEGRRGVTGKPSVREIAAPKTVLRRHARTNVVVTKRSKKRHKTWLHA
jgi:hypothetical protein